MINKEEYFDVKDTKKVLLPSGYTFEIKKIDTYELLEEPFPLKSNSDLSNSSDEKKQIRWKEMTEEERESQMNYNDMLISKALIDPILTKDEVQQIRKKRLNDYIELITEVTSFSLGGAKVDPLPESKVT